MKHMIKELKNHAKSNPKDFIMSAVLLVGIFVTLYVASTFNAIINGSH